MDHDKASYQPLIVKHVFTVLQCDTACPDFCFVWEEGEDKKGRKQMFLQGIDYQYCKGCLKCVEACPTGSLTEIREAIGFADENRVKHNFLTLQGV